MTADDAVPPTGLPIEEVVDDLRAALEHSNRAVLTAEPGAGKTTVVPLRMLDQRWLGNRKILMLEPRRVAARAAAARLAHLLGDRVGGLVGLVTREDRKVSAQTRIEVVTEGILTRRLQNDPGLDGVGLVIFDEFHERSLQADTGLAFTLDAVESLGLDLRILVMSATIDAERVAALLDDAPIIASEGRLFPVDIAWRPRNKKTRIENAAAEAIQWALGHEIGGDVLVFLPGMGEIRRTQRALSALSGLDHVDVRALHGSLPPAEQDLALRPSPAGRRRVVLSTDIAETSLTVEGVRIVVDAGLARRPQFDPRTGMTRLITVSNSRASADQRAGRAGRVEAGLAVRLWSKIEHGTRPAWDAPEITEVDLAGFLLELRAWGANDPTELLFVDPPPERSLREGAALLASLGAMDGDGALTALGRALVRIPLHPRLARMVHSANEVGHGWVACLLAALIDERDVLRGRPDEVPADVALRLDLLSDSNRHHPQASGMSLRRVRERAVDLARRVGTSTDATIDSGVAGAVLALAYPERIGQQRGRRRGRFRLRNGSGAWVAETDPLAAEDLIVAADLDGNRKDARIRLGAPLDGDDLFLFFSDEVEIESGLHWNTDRNDLVLRTRRTLGALDLGTFNDRPLAGQDTTAALLARIRSTRLQMLTWTDNAKTLRDRVAWLRSRQPEAWPDWSDKTLLDTLEDWLAPYLPGATGRADVETASVVVALDGQLSADQRKNLPRLTPTHLTLPSGRKRPIDYGGDAPSVRSRVQDFYGMAKHPTVLGGAEPLQVELLSPADRPVQITSDLIGFWTGSWADVRKDMAGRYPKHHWPVDPSVNSGE